MFTFFFLTVFFLITIYSVTFFVLGLSNKFDAAPDDLFLNLLLLVYNSFLIDISCFIKFSSTV